MLSHGINSLFISPFKIIYGVEPLSSLDLTPRAMEIKPNVEASKRERSRNSMRRSRARLNNLMPLTKPKQTNIEGTSSLTLVI